MYVPQKVVHQAQSPLEWWEDHHHHSDQVQALEKLEVQETCTHAKENC